MRNFGFLFTAYLLIWAGICVYLVRLNRFQKRIEDRIERIREQLGRSPRA
jgi:CcmD family protein